MKIFDLFFLILQGLKSRKSRLLFTITGISIGISAILFLVSLGYGLQKNLLEKITTAESMLTLDVSPPDTRAVILNEDMISQIKKIPNVEKVSPQAILAAQATIEGLNSEATANLIDSDFFSLSGVSVQKGRAFEKNDAGKVVINSNAGQLFNLSGDNFLGKKINLTFFVSTDEGMKSVPSSNALEIVGWIDDPEASPQIFVKKDELKDVAVKEYQVAKVKVLSETTLEEVRSNLIDMGFLVSALSDTIAQANKVFGAIQITLGVFGVIALIVAAIGLVNTMTISLLQRINEIGIMRAVGASPADIRRFFLGESIIIGFMGGILGIGLGIGFAELSNWLLNIVARNLGGQSVDLFFYPGWFLIFILVLSLFVGLMGGFFPARRAGKLNPLAALRYK